MGKNNTWLADRIRVMLPKREELESNRLLRPVAHLVLRPALWRFPRRSVPRAIGLGLFIGILVLIPGVQPVAAAFIAIPFRANVPLTAGTTLLSNPITTPLLLMASMWIGSDLFGFPADLASFNRLVHQGASLGAWIDWLLSSAAPAMLSGLVVLSVASGVVGYVAATFIWRLWIQSKWRRRRWRHESRY